MQDIAEVKERVFHHMLATRGAKYKWFIRALKSFKYASFNPTRGSLMETYYTLMRLVDDYVDRDAPLPGGFDSAADYVMKKIEFSKNLKNPTDDADHLLLHSYRLAEILNLDISFETDDILSSMLFDAKRYGKRMVFPREELEHHFHLLDVRGTIKATLKVFGESPMKYDALEPLGLASRVYYNLRDFEEDITAGLINIPEEDIQKYHINPLTLENRLSPGVPDWFILEAERGMDLLAQHSKNMQETKFRLLARIAAPLVYEKPATKYFEAVLDGRRT